MTPKELAEAVDRANKEWRRAREIAILSSIAVLLNIAAAVIHIAGMYQ